MKKKITYKTSKLDQPATKRDLLALEQRFDATFEKSNKNFKGIDNQFEKIDKKFDKIDERFEKIDERFEKLERKMLDHMSFLLQTMDEKDKALKQDLIQEINIRFDKQSDNHAELMSFLHEHFPIQQKIVHEHEVRIARIEQVLDIK